MYTIKKCVLCKKEKKMSSISHICGDCKKLVIDSINNKIKVKK